MASDTAGADAAGSGHCAAAKPGIWVVEYRTAVRDGLAELDAVEVRDSNTADEKLFFKDLVV